MFDEEFKMQLEAEGAVLEELDQPIYNTKYMIYHPDTGVRNLAYASFDQIPLLPHNTQIEIDLSAYPIDDRTGLSTAQYGTEVHFTREVPGAAWPPVWVFIVVLGVGVATVLVLNALRDLLRPSCQVSTTPIDNCRSIITLANCDGRILNSCTGEWESDWRGYGWISDLTTLLIIAGVVIGAIIIIPRLLPQRRAPPYYERPPERRRYPPTI